MGDVMRGIGGALVAGSAGQSMGWDQAGKGAGFVASIVVAIVLLVVYGRLRDKSSQ